jgi:hypothetical protein
VDQLLGQAEQRRYGRLVDFPGFGGCSPAMNREAGPLMNCENPTPELDFSGESTHETRMTFPVAPA